MTRSINGNYGEGAPQATLVEFDAANMYVHLNDGCVVTVPVVSYERLRDATPEQRLRFRIFGKGTGIRWDDIDEDLPWQCLYFTPPAKASPPLRATQHRNP